MKIFNAILFLPFLLIACKKSNKIAVVFNRVDNLQTGAIVFGHNVKIGEVHNMEIYKNKVLVSIRLYDTVKIPMGSTFTLMPNVFGNASIQVSYAVHTVFLTEKDTTYGENSSKLFLRDLVPDSIKEEKIRNSLMKINEGLNEILQTTTDSSQ